MYWKAWGDGSHEGGGRRGAQSHKSSGTQEDVEMATGG
eukprot:CAMPEP_0168719656 /NCGR_PEP_ID=MMETSP0724-20121128/1152_1 /TAXON_ID=265536 /ORGANISM="Amphiprora sp., Strain CCMP467" /LENGTH=37 /DNA_ID= /DNA_START= /DNA_END= /DNA_ORIENTATION=